MLIPTQMRVRSSRLVYRKVGSVPSTSPTRFSILDHVPRCETDRAKRALSRHPALVHLLRGTSTISDCHVFRFHESPVRFAPLSILKVFGSLLGRYGIWGPVSLSVLPNLLEHLRCKLPKFNRVVGRSARHGDMLSFLVIRCEGSRLFRLKSIVYLMSAYVCAVMIIARAGRQSWKVQEPRRSVVSVPTPRTLKSIACDMSRWAGDVARIELVQLRLSHALVMWIQMITK